ncbi:hypothetical protein ABDD95_00905 [Mucilaginibacter sp. PAMB04274]|uniref:hypothetical protein n=1 Tax=Mucilaginibacter sp. PAMB04274 TaxID=3138568 RepID=UPI0031F622CF
MLKVAACVMAFIMLLGLVSCRKNRVVNTSFYYWKTVYDTNATEKRYFDTLGCKKLYMRIMDVNKGDNSAVPISPVTFKAALPNAVQLVPVVFVVNDVLKHQTHQQLNDLAGKIVYYVNGRIKSSGKKNYNELQLDCDWTRTTRDNYFYLLRQISANAGLKNIKLSATLRLHQLKNPKNSGIPPVDRVMLMCYNMGNLRKYGSQNSILEQSALEKYVGENLSNYPMPVDVGLPVFSWAVVFRQKQYAGISKRLHQENFSDQRTFKANGSSLYRVQRDLPNYGLLRGDEVRWEYLPASELLSAANYIQKYISSDTLNVIFFHLDEPTLKHYTYENLEKTTAVFR